MDNFVYYNFKNVLYFKNLGKIKSGMIFQFNFYFSL